MICDIEKDAEMLDREYLGNLKSIGGNMDQKEFEKDPDPERQEMGQGYRDGLDF